MRFSSKKGLKKGRGNEAGLSLLEVLVGISILAVGLLAVAQMQITAIQGIDQSEEATVALNLAQEQLEQIINGDYNSADLADTITLPGPALQTLAPQVPTNGTAFPLVGLLLLAPPPVAITRYFGMWLTIPAAPPSTKRWW